MRRLPHAALLLAAVTLVASARPGATQTRRPLVTEDVEVLEDGQTELQVAFDLEQDFVSPSDATQGLLVRVPVVGVNHGVGDRAELQLRLPAVQYFAPGGYDSSTSVGDITLATKLRLAGGGGIWPGLGARVQVELPTSSADHGVGTGGINVRLELLLGIDLAGASIATNLGLGVLADPERSSGRANALLYGLGFLLPIHRFEIGADLNGRAKDSGDRWSALGAIATHFGSVRVDAAGGLSSTAGERSLLFTAGATFQFRFRTPRRQAPAR